MFNKSVTLPQEKWDKIIEFLNSSPIVDPDKNILLIDLHNQLEISPSDQKVNYPINSFTGEIKI